MPARHQAISWTNVHILLIGLANNFQWIWNQYTLLIQENVLRNIILSNPFFHLMLSSWYNIYNMMCQYHLRLLSSSKSIQIYSPNNILISTNNHASSDYRWTSRSRELIVASPLNRQRPTADKATKWLPRVHPQTIRFFHDLISTNPVNFVQIKNKSRYWKQKIAAIFRLPEGQNLTKNQSILKV